MKAFTCTHAGPHTGHGGFAYLFPRRQTRWQQADLVALAATMNEGMLPHTTAQQEKTLPAAGYTYLGQFIDHDLTSDSRLFGQQVGAAGVNLRTPCLDLDSLYGAGPGVDAHLYAGDRLRLDGNGYDLARHPDGRAAIKDQRNDANLIICQLHLAFARFHNRVLDSLSAGKMRFAEARRIVCNHYQWILLHDYLQTIAGKAVATTGSTGSGAPVSLLWAPSKSGAMPLEFSAAAFRFGHSMVRGAYVLNAKLGGQKVLFDRGQPNGQAADDLRGFRKLQPKQQIAWNLFFRMADNDPKPQLARPIDTGLSSPLFDLPHAVAQDQTKPGRNLAFRNLFRCEVDLGLATGQQVVKALRRLGAPGVAAPMPGLEIPIISRANAADRNIGGSGVGTQALNAILKDETPLWYFVLKEAEHFYAGTQLGPVGGQLVAEVFLGLLAADPESVLSTGWKPAPGKFGCSADGKYGIVNLLRYAAEA